MMTPKQVEISEIREQIDSLQMWFARKGYGWYDAATAEQKQQWDDRVREQEWLADRLDELQG